MPCAATATRNRVMILDELWPQILMFTFFVHMGEPTILPLKVKVVAIDEARIFCPMSQKLTSS